MPEKIRSPCPLANALDIVGDKWALLVIRDLILGATTHSELQLAPEGITTNILADRLKRLGRIRASSINRLASNIPRAIPTTSPTKAGD